MWPEVTSDWSQPAYISTCGCCEWHAASDALCRRRRAMLMVRMWSPPQSSPLSSWYNPFQWCKNRTYSEETLFYFTLILNQILIHILYWLGLRSEIDQLIILQNKRAGESKRPSRATSSPLRRRSSYYDQRLLKHTHRPHMWTPSTHTHTHTTLRGSIWFTECSYTSQVR